MSRDQPTRARKPQSAPTVFLDIGAHNGETLGQAMDARWGFSRILCFEPARSCQSELRRIARGDPRVEIFPVALWNADTELVLYDSGSVGASVFPEKPGLRGEPETVVAVDTQRFLASHLEPGSHVMAKVNVEGAELEILRGLVALQADRGLEFTTLLVHIDADKLPGHDQRADAVRRLLAELPGADQGMRGFFGPNVEAKTRNWLRWHTGTRARRLWIDLVERPLHTMRVAVWRARQRR